jgi:asparagine synthase (glutamine-hydrolysing)
MVFDRLAIHDLSHVGNQPFTEYLTPEEEFVYMCNGEIYNYHEIVKRHGFTMATQSDCEVIGKLFALYRDIRAVVAELDGEYAIAGIVLRRKKLDTIVVARDPFGVRPLYWATSGHGFIFSSLLAGIGVPGAEHVAPGDTWMVRKYDTQFNS